MAESWADEVEQSGPEPVSILAELPDIKLFGKWSCEDVNVSDMSVQVRKKNRVIINYSKFHSGFLNMIMFIPMWILMYSN